MFLYRSHISSQAFGGFCIQSSGKSSVLESVVGKDFLPRGSGDYCTLPSQILYLSFTQLLANDMLKNDRYCYKASSCLAAP